MIENKEYQSIDTLTSTITTKVKGYRLINASVVKMDAREFIPNYFQLDAGVSILQNDFRILDTVETVAEFKNYARLKKLIKNNFRLFLQMN